MKQTPLHKKAKAFTLLLTTLIMLLLAAATLVESHWGSQFAADHIYQAPWFCALWGMLVVLCVASIVKYQLWHRFSVMMLHVSFIVILAGAFTTYISSHKGVVHLVAIIVGEANSAYVVGCGFSARVGDNTKAIEREAERQRIVLFHVLTHKLVGGYSWHNVPNTFV